MIDWGNFFFNSLWILGCSLALATLSYTSWQASSTGEKLRTRLGSPRSQRWLIVAGMLFCVGLAGSSDTIWQTVLWAVLGVALLVQLIFIVFGS
jgi:hypothetical protein